MFKVFINLHCHDFMFCLSTTAKKIVSTSLNVIVNDLEAFVLGLSVSSESSGHLI